MTNNQASAERARELLRAELGIAPGGKLEAWHGVTFEQALRAIEAALTERLSGTGAGVEEARARIVAWLLEQSDKGADIAIAKDEGSTARSAYGGGSYALKRAADEIERGADLEGEAEIVCEACLRPVLRGQFVHCYEDVGEVHVDCDHPFAVSDDPKAVVMVGQPLRRAALSAPAHQSEEQN
jgi:hypothetical protein